MLFDLLYGWRKWHGQRGIWFVLIFSLCLFCALIGLVSSLLWMLSSDRPQWVAQQAPLITVANQDFNGHLQPTSVYDIALLQKLPGVESVASIALDQLNLSLGIKALPNIRVGFYSENLLDILTLPSPFSVKVWEQNKVIVSADFWREHRTSQSASDVSLYVQGSPLMIAGVAPAAMANIGDKPIDLWIPDSFLLKDVPSMFKDNPELYVNTQANRYGFAKLDKATSITAFQQAYQTLRQQTPRPEGGFVDHHFTPWLIDGVELQPNERAQIQKQAWIMVILLICFGFIICSGIVSAYAQQSIIRRSEIQLKIALGAHRWDLFWQLLRENLTAIIAIIIISPLLGLAFIEYVAKIPVYRVYFDAGLSFNSWLWCGAVLGSVCLYLACAQLPMFSVMQPEFSRARTGQMTKTQLLLSQFVLLLQITLVMAVVTLCLVLCSSEWRKYQQVNFSPTLHSFKPKVAGRLSMALSSEQLQGNWQIAANHLALSSKGFTQMGAQSLSYIAQGAGGMAKPVNSQYVSANFFDLLGIAFLIPATLSTDTVVINQTMAKQLANELELGHWQAVKGAELKITGFYYEKQVKVSGIIADQLHFGLSQQQKPVIYLHIGAQNPLIAHRLAPIIYADSANPQFIESHLNDWAGSQSTLLTYQAGQQLNQEIINTNSAGLLLFVTSCIMAVLICLLVVFTLYYRFYFSIKVQQLKWAILLALGGNKHQLVLHNIRLNILLSVIAGTCAVLLLLAVDDNSVSLLSISLFDPLMMGVSLISCVVLTVCISCWVSMRRLRTTIADMLRSNH